MFHRMMDRNYPSSSFADALAPPAQTVASWAYDRGSATIKPSPSYGAGHLDAELLQRQSYASTHQLPTYTTSHVAASPGTLESSSNTPETSIMSFLSAMESRSLQAGPVSASLLPPFRPPSWPAGTNSSTTELYLTGALPSTFPSPAALSSYQHTGAYPSKSYATNPSLPLQDPTFSTSTNGLFSHHDPLLHLKPSQTVLPTALAFNHLSTPALGSALPVQSSTYRSAQESAPHLLQPQFSLVPSALPAPHGAPQPYGATVFSGSIERALQRECSVIKHHQRPSSSHMASEQLPNSEQPLQGYFGSGTEAAVSYSQDPSQQTPVSCSPSTAADSNQGVNSSAQAKTDCVTQAYSSTTLTKTEDCSSKSASHTPGDEESHSQNLTAGSSECYSSPGQKQNSVIANQQAVQLTGLMSNSLSQAYITPHTQAQTSQSASDKLSPLYKTLPSLSSQSDNVVSVSQTLVYSTTPGLNQEQEIHYGAQVQTLCQGNLSESYPTPHSQGATNNAFTSQSQGQASVTLSQSYAEGQSLNSSYTSTCVQNLPTSNSTVDYTLLQASVGSKTHDTLSQQQTQHHKNVLSATLPTYSSSAQALQNSIRTSVQDLKPIYGKHKLEEIPLQDLESLQQGSMEASAAENQMASHNVIYVVSKMDDHHKTQSVIRSNSRSDDQHMGIGHSNTAQVKDERMGPLSQQQLRLISANGHQLANTKTTNSTIVSSHLCSEQLKQRPLQLKSPEPLQQNQQNHSQSQSQTSAHTQFITVPSTQVLLEPSQMILLQQPLVHHSQNSSKLVSVQGIQSGQGVGPMHVQYLQMDRNLLGSSFTETQSQQGTVVSEPSSECLSSSKDHYSQTVNQQTNDTKNHFALNSICFPDSMLLTDDRNILSNVDDILAATVAACGVTPQDFVKATSSAEAEMAAMASPIDSKGHFQTVDIRHMSPSFSSAQQAIISNTNSHAITMTLNGAQMATNCQGQSVGHKNSTELHINGNGRSSENDYHLTGQVYDPSGPHHRVKGNEKCVKTEDGLMECSGGEDFPKKKARSKSLTKAGGAEEDGAMARQAKRTGQTKRQNSGSSDVSSPTAAHSMYDGCPQQERIRQKIREVEEKQPEVKTGFIGSFLDFIKSGPKQQYSQSPTRTASRPRKPCTPSKPCALPALPAKVQTVSGPLVPQESPVVSSQQKRLDEDLQKNLETLPSFSSDEEENTGKNQALRNSISSALSSLDESSDRKSKTDNQIQVLMVQPNRVSIIPHTVTENRLAQVVTPTLPSNTVSGGTQFLDKEDHKETTPCQLAVQLISVAIGGLTDEELSDSGGEGMYRERDEFVVRNEDIENLKVTMKAGSEPPAIWKVQKALLQKFVPELRDGKRVFSATNSYLGYFGDAKTMYQRVYVKFLDTVNKREYVRVCSRKPRCKPMNSLRGVPVKTLLGLTANNSSGFQSLKPRPKQLKPRAEPPPKKRRKWKEEFQSTASGSSAEEGGEDDVELNPPLPFAARCLNTRTMKETFKSFVELLISIALDEDVMTALERANDELLLPHMKRVDGMITDNRKRLLHKLHIGQVLKTALDSFPEISVVTELKKDGETPAFKVRLSGKAYNKKTMKPYKMPNKVPQEYTVDQQKTQWFSLYHSLQHYKYHTYLMCKDEIASLRVQAGDLGQEETVQKCLQNGAWLEGLFERFGDLINQVQQACR